MLLRRIAGHVCRGPRRLERARRCQTTIASTFGNEQKSADTSNNARPFSEIPGPKGLPFIGTLLQYKWGPFEPPRYHDALVTRYRQYGDIFKETIAGRTVVHLFHPSYIKTVYLTEGKLPHIPPLLETTQLYRRYRNMSPGLGNTNGDEWYRMRSAVQQMMMMPVAVSAYLPAVNQVADDFLSRIGKRRNGDTGRVPNFMNEIQMFILESSAMTCFETRIGALTDAEDSFAQKMIDANNSIFALSLKLQFGLPWFKYFPTKTWNLMVQNEDYFFRNGQKLVDDTIEKIRTLIANDELKSGQYNFLTYLMGRDALSERDVSIITLSLFNDGLKTTAPSIASQLYCLAKNADKQDILYKEICKYAPDKDQDITSNLIDQMSYLKACFKEGFRLFPIGTEISRIPQKDLVIGNYHIPAGTHIQLNNNLLLKLPEYFEKPNSYQPERWLRGSSESTKVDPYLLLPFGYGPRMCAGRRFAEQDMSVILIKILQRYRLEWDHTVDLNQEYEMLLKPNQRLLFKFAART